MTGSEQTYDRIGKGYSANRRPDPRIAVTIHNALHGAGTILNVGAGSGSYEPAQAKVFAVEPSWEMIRQRPAGAAPVLRALAGALPFGNDQFDASMAILTVHHWGDPAQGLRELMRVSSHRLVIFTWDPNCRGFWLSRDYFPELDMVHAEMFPKLGNYEKALGKISIAEVPIPHDCSDGFLCAYWRRPQAYLEPGLRASMSVFSKIKREAEGVEALRRDLASGLWEKRNAAILDQDSLDLGYRLIVKEF